MNPEETQRYPLGASALYLRYCRELSIVVMKNKHHTYDSKVLTITVKSPGTGSYTWMERISEFLKEKGILK